LPGIFKGDANLVQKLFFVKKPIELNDLGLNFVMNILKKVLILGSMERKRPFLLAIFFLYQ